MDSDSGPVSSYFQMDWAMDYTAGLVARERSGHTALLEGGFLYVWGGYVSIADDEVFLPNDEIWLYDIESGICGYVAWVHSSHIKGQQPFPPLLHAGSELGNLEMVRSWRAAGETHVMRGEVPPPMSGMCGSSLNGEMYVFGGCNEDGHTNQLYHVNLLDGKYTWRKVMNSSGAPPTPRDKLSCWVYKNRLIYFGGYGDKHFRQLNNSRSFVVDEALWVEEVFWGWNNEVHVFNPSTASWSEPHTHGLAPAPRAAHAGATLGSRGYVCGGRVMETRMSDIHCLDLESWTWTEIPMSAIPMGRSWHTLTAVSDTTLFLFGGISVDCAPLSDGWIFDVQAKLWRELEHPHKDKPRLWHTASLGKDSDVIVFGGSQDDILFVDKGHCNDALVFQTQPYTLLRLCEDYMGKNPWVLQDQLLWLPRKLKQIIIKRISFFKPTAKSQEIIHAT
ncbi:kelch domain-containing protein 1 isoform X2 [Anguilla anguilla]|uniref:kelch domain-containing protein 1 isoform X2 n=1 Tax=Anguilla anguilla TaxID=7936 RepID=UPI0015ACA6FB|nr:kelch domain-containing protein 1 isoform X2 [Anguilla anguilla]